MLCKSSINAGSAGAVVLVPLPAVRLVGLKQKFSAYPFSAGSVVSSPKHLQLAAGAYRVWLYMTQRLFPTASNVS